MVNQGLANLLRNDDGDERRILNYLEDLVALKIQDVNGTDRTQSRRTLLLALNVIWQNWTWDLTCTSRELLLFADKFESLQYTFVTRALAPLARKGRRSRLFSEALYQQMKNKFDAKNRDSSSGEPQYLTTSDMEAMSTEFENLVAQHAQASTMNNLGQQHFATIGGQSLEDEDSDVPILSKPARKPKRQSSSATTDVLKSQALVVNSNDPQEEDQPTSKTETTGPHVLNPAPQSSSLEHEFEEDEVSYASSLPSGVLDSLGIDKSRQDCLAVFSAIDRITQQLHRKAIALGTREEQLKLKEDRQAKAEIDFERRKAQKEVEQSKITLELQQDRLEFGQDRLRLDQDRLKLDQERLNLLGNQEQVLADRQFKSVQGQYVTIGNGGLTPVSNASMTWEARSASHGTLGGFQASIQLETIEGRTTPVMGSTRQRSTSGSPVNNIMVKKPKHTGSIAPLATMSSAYPSSNRDNARESHTAFRGNRERNGCLPRSAHTHKRKAEAIDDDTILVASQDMHHRNSLKAVNRTIPVDSLPVSRPENNSKTCGTDFRTN